MDRHAALQERLIRFAARLIRLAGALPRSKAGTHVAGQILRSGTAPAANYGEARDAESRSDFVHKAKVVLKELRETDVWLRIIVEAELISPRTLIEPLLSECGELTAIFVSSVKTAKRRGRVET